MALQLLMQVMGDENDYVYLRKIIEILLRIEHGQETRDYFAREYFDVYENIRHRTFSILR